MPVASSVEDLHKSNATWTSTEAADVDDELHIGGW